MTIYWITDH